MQHERSEYSLQRLSRSWYTNASAPISRRTSSDECRAAMISLSVDMSIP